MKELLQPPTPEQLKEIGIHNFPDFLQESKSSIDLAIAQVAVAKPLDVTYPSGSAPTHVCFLKQARDFYNIWIMNIEGREDEIY